MDLGVKATATVFTGPEEAQLAFAYRAYQCIVRRDKIVL
jgi:hypothetical protein